MQLIGFVHVRHGSISSRWKLTDGELVVRLTCLTDFPCWGQRECL